MTSETDFNEYDSEVEETEENGVLENNNNLIESDYKAEEDENLDMDKNKMHWKMETQAA